MAITTWTDSAHSTFSVYWNQLQDEWIQEYNTYKKDYIREMFLKLVGLDFYKFELSTNKRVNNIFDKTSGLREWDDSHGDSDPYRFNSNGYSFMLDELGDYYSDKNALRRVDIDNFDPTNGYFGSLDETDEFQFCFKYKFDITSKGYYSSYNRDNGVISKLLIANDNLHQILSNIGIDGRRVKADGIQYRETIDLRMFNCYIRFEYDEGSVNHNKINSFWYIDNNPFVGYSSYEDEWNPKYLSSSSRRCVTIKSNKPLFDKKCYKFFQLLEKIGLYNNRFIIDYKSCRNELKPETQFIEQLVLKYCLIDNQTIKEIASYLNKTKDRSFKPDANDIIACYVNWPFDDTIGYRGDVVANRLAMIIEKSCPQWFDLEKYPLITNYINMMKYQRVALDSQDAYQERCQYCNKVQQFNEIISDCNLYSYSMMDKLCKQYEDYLTNK